MNKVNEKSFMAHVITCLCGELVDAFDLILRDATSTNADQTLRNEVATALWENALFKLAKFTDSITILANNNPKTQNGKKDRERAIKLFNLESDTVVNDCDINKIRIFDMLRFLRHEMSHGVKGFEITPLRRVQVSNGAVFALCRTLSNNEQCNCNVIHCEKRINTPHPDRVFCDVAISDVRDAVRNELKQWHNNHKIEVEKEVDRRRKSQKQTSEKKPKDYFPWWYEQSQSRDFCYFSL